EIEHAVSLGVGARLCDDALARSGQRESVLDDEVGGLGQSRSAKDVQDHLLEVLWWRRGGTKPCPTRRSKSATHARKSSKAPDGSSTAKAISACPSRRS